MDWKDDKWEYLIVYIGEVSRNGQAFGLKTAQNALFQEGLEGWELVTVENGVAYMKRRWRTVAEDLSRGRENESTK